MKTLTELLNAQVEVNFFDASNDLKRFIVGTARSVAITYIKQFQDVVNNIPSIDQGSIDYIEAQDNLIKDMLAMTGEIVAIGRGPRQVSRVEVSVADKQTKKSEVTVPGVGDGGNSQEMLEPAYKTPAPQPQNSSIVTESTSKEGEQS